MNNETESVEQILKPMTAEDLSNVLGLTIKKDNTNKVITFLTQISAYTEDSQLNISFNAPSSSGKSYIPTEIAELLPEGDVLEVGYCSPTAFFHDVSGAYNKKRNEIEIDLSRKVLIFLDQPHTLLLQHLRPLLSHDRKVINIKITDKSQKGGLRTKNIKLKGFPAVIFCSAGLTIDEQEATRFLLLSPEISQEKIRASIHEKIKKSSDPVQYIANRDADFERMLLKKRVQAIKNAQVVEIIVSDTKSIEERFLSSRKTLKPRHQRDIGYLISFIKLFALVNFWHREFVAGILFTNEADTDEAFKLWESISESQELNLSPYVHSFYKEIILPAYEKKYRELGGGVKSGLSRQDIFQKHHAIHDRPLPDWQLRQQLLPQLETAGLIRQEPDPDDKRRILIYPATDITTVDNS